MRLTIRHRTAYAYAPPALRAALRLRLWPSRFEAQTPIAWRVSVNGEAVAPLLEDGFGDAVGQWHAHAPVETVEAIAEGVVETRDAAGVVRGLPGARAVGVFLRATELTAADEGLRDLARSVADEGDALARLHALNAAVHAAVAYRPGVTGADTAAARALALGAGVCQDHAHVFIAAARVMGVPARYVAGYMLAGEDAPEGGHETHAWAEAHVEDLGWVAFDPSLGVCPAEAHVRLSAGLDARAAAPVRGAVTGASTETLEARVDIARAAEAQAQQ